MSVMGGPSLRRFPAAARTSLLTAALAWTAAVSLAMGCGASSATSSVPSPSTSPASSSTPLATAEPSVPRSRTPPPAQRSSARTGSETRSIPAPPSLIGLGVPAPVRVRIPAIGLDSGLSLLDRNPDGTIQLPPDVGQAGWYRRGVAPGDMGIAVIMGDVGSPPTPGVFSRLSGVRAGDAIRIQREDGTELQFTAQRSLAYSPSAFPFSGVYGRAGGSELRLVTCGGTAASGGSSTPGDAVVFATLSG
jgi:Sortase domain